MAPDPTFAFVGGPWCPTLDFVIAFWIMIYVSHIVNFAILYHNFTALYTKFTVLIVLHQSIFEKPLCKSSPLVQIQSKSSLVLVLSPIVISLLTVDTESLQRCVVKGNFTLEKSQCHIVNFILNFVYPCLRYEMLHYLKLLKFIVYKDMS
jgi:hypothetical protein